jgi:hypothetical protein
MFAIRTAIVVSALLTGCAAKLQPSSDMTVALRADDAVVALTWDGTHARVFQDGEQIGDFDADSRDSALWGWRQPGAAVTTAPRTYDRVLTSDELAALGACDWSPRLELQSCGTDAACGCGQAVASR